MVQGFWRMDTVLGPFLLSLLSAAGLCEGAAEACEVVWPFGQGGAISDQEHGGGVSADAEGGRSAPQPASVLQAWPRGQGPGLAKRMEGWGEAMNEVVFRLEDCYSLAVLDLLGDDVLWGGGGGGGR